MHFLTVLVIYILLSNLFGKRERPVNRTPAGNNSNGSNKEYERVTSVNKGKGMAGNGYSGYGKKISSDEINKIFSDLKRGRKNNKGMNSITGPSEYSGKGLEISELTDTRAIVRMEKERMKLINDAFRRDIEIQHAENRKLMAESKKVPM